MSKRDEKIEHYIKSSKELRLGLSEELITQVTISLGPSIYNKNAEIVACSQQPELDRVKKNFLEKKLEIPFDEEVYNKAIEKVCKKMKTSNKTKYRALFYALLVKEFKKESLYIS